MKTTAITLIEQGAVAVLTAVSTFISTNQTSLPQWSGVVLGVVSAALVMINALLGKNGQTVAAQALRK